VVGTLSHDGVAASIEARRVQWQADLDGPEPPIFLVGDEGVAAPLDRNRLQGQGLSAGRIRGRVRRVDHLSMAHELLPGEILVTRAVDPAWTPLFQIAGGAVLGLGGMLSHGAVVAREYGLPLVVSPEGGLRLLTTGQEVTVDGTRGLIWVHSD
jgi:pyruvate,water dikinase